MLFIWFPGILSPTPPWKRSAFPSHSSRTTCNIPGHALLAALCTLVPGDPNATVSTSGKAPCELNPSNLHSFSAPMPALQACLPWLENEAVRRSFRRSGSGRGSLSTCLRSAGWVCSSSAPGLRSPRQKQRTSSVCLGGRGRGLKARAVSTPLNLAQGMSGLEMGRRTRRTLNG